ncbi:DUF416 family protein [Haliscomenobacter sp.]|uniref:DUF416 family protein n=1 Tax=Haliscomenobacter sp. TaxID=2717303 RepID=UPI003BA8F618
MKIAKQIFNTALHLTFPQQGLFACLIVDKMKANFDYFFSQDKEKIKAATAILNACFDYITAFPDTKKFSLSSFSEQIEALTPDLDEEEGVAAYAFDFCIACHSLLRLLHDFDLQELETVIEQAIATVDMFIQEYLDLDPSDADLEYKIADSPFMLNELERQQALLSSVQTVKIINEEQVFKLRDMNRRFPEMVNLRAIYPG